MEMVTLVEWALHKTQNDSTTGLQLDAFPQLASEWKDSDSDGVGDNSDWAIHDSFEQYDSDGDGVGDNADVEPNSAHRSVNTAPLIGDIENLLVSAGATLSQPLNISDAENDAYSVELVNAPDFVEFSQGALSLSLQLADEGQYSFRVFVKDSYGFASTATVEFTVSEAQVSSSKPNDFNGDGTTDLLLHNEDGVLISTIMSNGAVQSQHWLGQYPGHNVLPGDFNGDGTTDILVQRESDGATVFWMMREGVVDEVVWYGIHRNTKFQYAEFNNDDTADLLQYDTSSGATIAVNIRNGAAIASNWLGVHPSRELITGDFDGDGGDDLLMHNRISGSSIILMLNDGAFVDWASDTRWLGLRPETSFYTADFNADGTTDILLFDNDTGAAVSAIINDGRITQSHWLSVRNDWVMALGDFSGDGKSDLFMRRKTDSATMVQLLEDGALAQAHWFGVNQGADFVFGDFDGDATQDVIRVDQASGAAISMLIENGQDTQQGSWLGQFSGLWPFDDRLQLIQTKGSTDSCPALRDEVAEVSSLEGVWQFDGIQGDVVTDPKIRAFRIQTTSSATFAGRD